MTETVQHWSDGKAYAGTSGVTAPVTNPATGAVRVQLAMASVQDAQHVIDAAAAAFPAWRDTSLAKRTADHLPVPGAAQRAQTRVGEAHHRRARQGALRRARRDQPRSRGRRIRLRHAASAQGRDDRERLDQGRRGLDPPTARPGRHHHAVQLPGHGADVVLPHRHRRGQHRGAQAEREGPVRVDLDGATVGRGRAARRGVQRPAGRQDRRRRTADQPEDQVDQLRRVHPHRPVRLRDGNGGRQAGPGSRWREEPHGRAARRRPRPGRRRRSQRGLRLGRRTLHGHQRPRRGGWCRRRSGRQDRRARQQAEDRRRHQGFRHGPTGHQGAPRQGGVLRRCRRGRRRHPGRRRTHRVPRW